MKRMPIILILLCALLIGCTAQDAPQAKPAANTEPETETVVELTMEPTPEPTATPEPITAIRIETAYDAELLKLGTIRTAEIADGALDNEAIAKLISQYPDVAFVYSVQVGERYVAPDTTELERAENESVETLTAAAPYLPLLTTVHLGACEPRELAAAFEAFPADTNLTYSVMLYGQALASDATELDLAGQDMSTPEPLLEALPYLPNLQTVALGKQEPETVAALLALDTGVTFTYSYSFTYLDKTLTESTEKLDLTGVKITDLNALRDALRKLPNLKHLEMVNCGLDNPTMASLRDEFPDVKVVWEIDLGYWGKLRTDATAFSTRSHKTEMEVKKRLTSETAQPVMYCTDLVALDLGHQKITDISFLKPLKKLKVLILADNLVSDLSVLSELTDLEYIELFMNRVTDLTPLANLTKLQDLNLCSNRVKDFSPLYGIKTLGRLWYARNDYAKDAHQKLQEQLPNCLLNHTVRDGTGDGWREHERYFWMRAFFEGAPRYVK